MRGEEQTGAHGPRLALTATMDAVPAFAVPLDLHTVAESVDDVHMMEDGSVDLSSLREEDFEQLAVYQVRDQPCEEGQTNRAEASLPRNLLLKPSQTLSDVLGVWSTDYIPRGTRFGPLTGEIYQKDAVPANANRKYFWRVYDGSESFYYVDGFDRIREQLQPADKDDSYYSRPHQLTPPEGSTRSDEGYHSNGGPEDGLTPPEDSSDSDSENYVLDFSVNAKRKQPASGAGADKAEADKREDKRESAAVAAEQPEKPPQNEFRKVKIKMPKAYHYRSGGGAGASTTPPPAVTTTNENPSPNSTSSPGGGAHKEDEKRPGGLREPGSPKYPSVPRFTEDVLERSASSAFSTYEGMGQRISPQSPKGPPAPGILENLLLQRYQDRGAADGSPALRRESLKEPVRVIVSNELHKRLHTNERPYTCQTCKKKYISASGLRTHWKTTSCQPNMVLDMELDKSSNGYDYSQMDLPSPTGVDPSRHHGMSLGLLGPGSPEEEDYPHHMLHHQGTRDDYPQFVRTHLEPKSTSSSGPSSPDDDLSKKCHPTPDRDKE
ncbi:hypothetical protein IscW_ISCW023811 [Ixodes scapularis]|uniref:SET domain-containing protein n=1 Tax=Ixodes scapularis TaxID=6945 RepID=B7QH58_IXOSC|nr:hypothetical protein IscW_ISCW023811 [Ixodes scapularis]|eukprot:XP_002414515.1 hypothetical protein IscW_ISCW023811 [Ixodes scapularis]